MESSTGGHLRTPRASGTGRRVQAEGAVSAKPGQNHRLVKPPQIRVGQREPAPGLPEVLVLLLSFPAAPISQGTGPHSPQPQPMVPHQTGGDQLSFQPRDTEGQSSLSSWDLKLREGKPLPQSYSRSAVGPRSPVPSLLVSKEMPPKSISVL